MASNVPAELKWFLEVGLGWLVGGRDNLSGKKPAMKVKQRAEDRLCLGLWLEGVGAWLIQRRLT